MIIVASSWSYLSIHIKDARSYEHQIFIIQIRTKYKVLCIKHKTVTL